jgi:hypothetical protein
VRAVINHARRNSLVHGNLGASFGPAHFSFFKREVSDRMKVGELRFTAKEFRKHVTEVDHLIAEAMKALRLYGNDVEEYAHEAGLFRPTRKRPEARRQNAKNGKRRANRQRQSLVRCGSQPRSYSRPLSSPSNRGRRNPAN